jgi:branched-chain amino acid transport system permease protein
VKKLLRFDRSTVVSMLALLLVTTTPLLGQPYLTRFATSVLIFGLAVMSLDVLVGYGGMVSFGHAAFFGLGAYSTAVLGFHGIHSAFIATPVAIGVAALAAFVIGGISLRTSGVYFIMITLAFGQMLFYVAHALAIYGGDDGLKVARNSFMTIFDFNHPTTFFFAVLIIFLAAFIFSFRLCGSRFGRALQGIRDNPERAESLGYDTYRYKLVGFIIGGALAGLAGMLYANLNQYVSPDLLDWVRSGDLLIMLILGGVGTLVGPVFGAATYLLLHEVLSIYTRHWMLVLGPLLLVIVLYSSGGIYGLLMTKTQDE